MRVKDVWFNQGRWIARCPKCGGKNKITPQKDKTIRFFCGGCYPNKFAKKPQQLPGGKIHIDIDQEKKRQAAQHAKNRNEIYIVDMPEDWENVEKLMLPRRLDHQGFYPGNFDPPNHRGETYQELLDEQEKAPVLQYLRDARKNPVGEKEVPVEELPDKPMSDKYYRELQ